MSEWTGGPGSVNFHSEAAGSGQTVFDFVTRKFPALWELIDSTLAANPFDKAFGQGDRMSGQIREAFSPAFDAGLELMQLFWDRFQSCSSGLGAAKTIYMNTSGVAADAARGGGGRY